MPALAERLADVQAQPENHQHDYGELIACCAVDGKQNEALVIAHAEVTPFGWNGGRGCSTNQGPCDCGAWH